MRATLLLPVSILIAGSLYTDANSQAAEPTREGCMAAVSAARQLAETLPADDLSRYFAERHLAQALVEAGNGEFDDCLEWAERATDEVKQHRHQLQPGEKLNIRPANE